MITGQIVNWWGHIIVVSGFNILNRFRDKVTFLFNLVQPWAFLHNWREGKYKRRQWREL